MEANLLEFLAKETHYLQGQGLWRQEMTIGSAQGPTVVSGQGSLINLGSSDYLGMANRSGMKKAVKLTIDQYGVGLGTTRMFAGTMPIHRDLERTISQWLQTEETLLCASNYHAATGIFEALFDSQDSIFVDQRASPELGQGLRFCEAKLFAFSGDALELLEDKLQRSQSARFKAIVTSGVSPIDGSMGPLAQICDIAERYDALVVMDDTHGLGIMGAEGRGAAEHHGILGRVHLTTGSLEHTLGAGGGGFVSGKSVVISWLRQKAKSYLLSAAPGPAVVGAAMEAIKTLPQDKMRLQRLRENASLLRQELAALGLRVQPGDHPIVVVEVGGTHTAQAMADELFKLGVYVVGICHPVVPEGQALIRAQVSAGHTQKMLLDAAKAFGKAALTCGLISQPGTATAAVVSSPPAPPPS